MSESKETEPGPNGPSNRAIAEAVERGYVFKAHVIGRDLVRTSAAVKDSEDQATSQIFGEGNVLHPAFDPEVLLRIWENSGSLTPNVDSYVTNIDGLGHTLQAVVDFDSEEAFETVRELMWIERLRHAEQAELEAQTDADPDTRPATVDAQALFPSDDEVEAKIKVLESQARIERVRLNSFFDFANPEGSFTTLRRQTRLHLEITGNAYWEVLRNRAGEIARFVLVPPSHVRCTPQDPDPTLVRDRVPLGLGWEVVSQFRCFRRYVQRVSRKTVWFKQFGDPRVVSQLTGKVYGDRAEFEEHKDQDTRGERDRPATEIVHFKIPKPGEAYGQPRWIGSLLSVLGSRAADEVNFSYFDNKAVPPMALLVSGGKLNDATVDKLETYVRDEIRGRQNFHKILVIEATGTALMSGETPIPKIEFKPLTAAQQGDAQFQTYDERNIDKVGSSFRLPRLLRGDVRDFNRSCYSADTETLTEQGWKLHSEIAPDERIAAYDPATGEVRFVVPEKKLVYQVEDEEMLRFHGKTTDCLVTSDHRMLVRPVHRRHDAEAWEVHEAGEIPYRRFDVVLAAAEWKGCERDAPFELPKTSACKIERGHTHRGPVSFDDWLEFLGYFISEGGLLVTDHPAAPYLVYVDQKDPENVAKIRSCLDRLGWKYSVQEKPCGTVHFLFSNRCLRDWLIRNVGTHSRVKQIPKGYLDLSTRQLRVLFDAMMLGDGTVDSREGRTNATYYTGSSVLADQVQRLLIQIGMRSTVGFGASVFRIGFVPKRTTELRAVQDGRLPPSVERVRYTGDVYCFSVPGFGFFVTRRNGKVAIQGNTADASLRFADEQVFQPERNEFDSWINRVLLPRLNARLWTFRSLGPRTRDPEMIAEIVSELLDVIVPNEARAIVADALGWDLPKINEGWAKQPLKLTLAGFPTPDEEEAIQEAVDDMSEAAAAGEDGPVDELRLLTADARAIAARSRAMQDLHGAADAAVTAGKRRRRERRERRRDAAE